MYQVKSLEIYLMDAYISHKHQFFLFSLLPFLVRKRFIVRMNIDAQIRALLEILFYSPSIEDSEYDLCCVQYLSRHHWRISQPSVQRIGGGASFFPPLNSPVPVYAIRFIDMRDKVQFGRIVRASRCGRWRCKIYRGIAQSRLQRAPRSEFLLFPTDAACDHVIRRHTYVPAKIYRSAMGVTCKTRRRSITNGGMHDDRVISNFCLAPRAYRKVYLVSERTNSCKLSSRPVYRSRCMPIG